MGARVLIVFDGKPKGTVEHMASVIASGVRQTGVEAICEDAANARASDFAAYEGIIIGSPCYFAGPSAKLKALMDETYGLRGKLVGKVGAAFTASQHIGGGNELTLRAISDFFLIHGMVIQGDAEGDHFGAIALSPTGDKDEVVVDESGECHRLGQRVGELVNRLAG